jgi:tripartite-type tricarboxylate transporter receptor subunit TctC
MSKRVTVVIALAAVLAATGMARAQNYPTKPVTMVIPFAAGGPTDVLGRVVGQRMSEVLGQQVVVENVGGAGGMTGMKRVADASPDGYTFGIGTVGTQAQSQTMYKKPLYNSVTAFTPVALLAEVPIVLITRKNLPVNNLKEFIAYTKANQAKMQYGSAGAGSATHLGCVLLNYLIGVDVTHVPYRGTGPAMQDLQGGRIDYMCEVVSTAKPQIDGGTVKGIAIMTKERSPALPNVPTGIEQGTPKLEAYTWNAIFLPKGAPADVVKKLNNAAVQALNTPAVRDRLTQLGAVVVSDDRATPQYLGEFLKSEIEKWAGPIKASGVSVD